MKPLSCHLVCAKAPQGGTECAVCTALVGLVEQLAVLHPGPIIDIMENYCRTLPEPAQDACIQFVNTYGRRGGPDHCRRPTPQPLTRGSPACRGVRCL